MDYFELVVESANPGHTEILIAWLSVWSFESFAEEDKQLKAYIPELELSSVVKNEIEDFLREEKTVFSWKKIKTENWNSQWESNFQPIAIDKDVLIRADFHPSDSSFLHEIVINPKMAFGTGHHQTTYLVMKVMLQLNFSQKSVLDMGCGTGILAILAHRLGANKLVAIDNDEWAYENCIENCTLNKVPCTTILGGKETIPNQKFDFIIANINKLILLDQIEVYSKSIRSEGILILSGFYKEDADDLILECQRNGFTFVEYLIKDNWCMLHLIKN